MGGFRNDIWVANISFGSRAGWKFDERFNPLNDKMHNPGTVKSEMKWEQTNPGYEPPTTWPAGQKKGQSMTYDDWIMCQSYFNERISDRSVLCN